MRRRLVLQGLAATTGMALARPSWGQTSPKRGRWLRLESPNFIVYSSMPEDGSRKEVIALEQFHAMLLQLMPQDAPSTIKLTVYLAGASWDFSQIAPRMPDHVAGFYGAGVEEIRAVADIRQVTERQRDMPKNVRASDARLVLFHEYAHHFMRANLRMTYPPWYREGFAEFLSTVEFTGKGCILGTFTMNRAQWLTMGSWLKIEDFLAKNPATMSPEKTSQFYAQSWLAAHFLFSRKDRAAGFTRYCNALREGGDSLGSFEGAFGITPAAFDKELREYKNNQLVGWNLPEPPVDVSSVSVTPVDSGADQILMPLAHLRSLPEPEDARQSVELIRAEAGKLPDNIFAMRAHAMAEVWYGDLAVARQKLDVLLTTDSTTAETLHLSGLCDLRAGYAASDDEQIKKAAGQFARAHKIDASRSSSLFRYVESSLNETGELTPHLVDVLVMAYNQTPQVDFITLMAAQALMQNDRFKEAVYLLSTMVGELHSDGRAEVAMDLLSEARAEKMSSFTFFGSARP